MGVISAELNAWKDCIQLQRLLNSTYIELLGQGRYNSGEMPMYQPGIGLGYQLAFCSSHYVFTLLQLNEIKFMLMSRSKGPLPRHNGRRGEKPGILFSKIHLHA